MTQFNHFVKKSYMDARSDLTDNSNTTTYSRSTRSINRSNSISRSTSPSSNILSITIAIYIAVGAVVDVVPNNNLFVSGFSTISGPQSYHSVHHGLYPRTNPQSVRILQSTNIGTSSNNVCGMRSSRTIGTNNRNFIPYQRRQVGSTQRISLLQLQQQQQQQDSSDEKDDGTTLPQKQLDEQQDIHNDSIPSLSLESILQKARKRPMIMLLPYKIQAFTNKPLFQISIIPTVTKIPSTITIGDMCLIVFAIYLNSIGFAIGYGIGKLTTQPLREWTNVIPIALVELWTVGLAVGLDVIWRNI